MRISIRYPQITGTTEREQLVQVKGYLYQLVNDLNYALSFIPENGNGEADSTASADSTSFEGKAGEVQYSDLRALLAQELQKAENLIDQIEKDLASGKLNGPQGEKGVPGEPGISVTHSWEGTVLTITSASGTSSADLKGEKGDPGEQGLPGEPGKDYVLTEDDKAEIVQAVLDALAEKPNEEE